MIRLHFDEHVKSSIARGLRLRGIDITTTVEAKLCGAIDLDHIEFANREGRSVVTNDEDFLILTASGVEHPGVFFVKQRKRSVGFLVRTLETLCRTYTPEDMRNTVKYL